MLSIKDRIQKYICEKKKKKPSLHQELTDVLKLAHVGELLLHQLLDSTTHSDRNDLQAAAGGETRR